MQPTIQHLDGDCQIYLYGSLSTLEHLHTSFEVAVPRRGTIRVRLDGRERAVRPGEIVVIFPGVSHCYSPTEGGEGMILIFSDRMVAGSEGEWGELQPTEPVVELDGQDRDVAHCLDRLNEMAVSGAMDEALAGAYLSLMFLRLMPALRPERPVLPVTKDLLYRAMQYISQNLAAPLSLRGTAHALGVNTYYLSHVLNERLHMGFRAYLNALRIDRARRYLRVTSWSIEEIAAACGFLNLRTFDRVFADRCSCTPRDFRKAAVALRQAQSERR